jgi:hypothetical protein
MSKKVFFIIIFLFIGGVILYNYVYKDHRNIEREEAIVKISALNLIAEFKQSPFNASQKYLDKTIQVFGEVTLINDKVLELDNSINCYFIDTIIKKYPINESITIKGRCIGYDELLEEVKIDQCIIY